MTVDFPLGRFICVTGVSGSGKSSLITDTLYRKLAQVFYRAKDKPGAHDAMVGIEHLDKVIDIDQSPIGRTPRSNPATYTGLFTPIRELFATVPEAKLRGYKAGRFSFNVKGGRCEACHGEGIIQIEMQFLPDVYVPCEVCHGKRYNRDALEIRYKGKTIADVLEMTVEEGLAFFDAIPAIKNKLQTLHDVGLGYIRLGQPATQLSGGEAQRVKLATELSKRADRQDAVHPRRADHRPALRRHRPPPPGPPPPGRRRQHRPGDRAQPRRDQERRPPDRHRPGGRPPRRPHRRHRHPRGGRRQPRLSPATSCATSSASAPSSPPTDGRG